ncbi:MAG: hypothetical protein P8Y02_14815 [Deinococcales bacterium]
MSFTTGVPDVRLWVVPIARLTENWSLNVGYGSSAGLTVTSGSSTTDVGTVGSIDAADYSANDYDFGLFTYVQPIDGQEVEVVNYWTVPQ